MIKKRKYRKSLGSKNKIQGIKMFIHDIDNTAVRSFEAQSSLSKYITDMRMKIGQMRDTKKWNKIKQEREQSCLLWKRKILFFLYIYFFFVSYNHKNFSKEFIPFNVVSLDVLRGKVIVVGKYGWFFFSNKFVFEDRVWICAFTMFVIRILKFSILGFIIFFLNLRISDLWSFIRFLY